MKEKKTLENFKALEYMYVHTPHGSHTYHMYMKRAINI